MSTPAPGEATRTPSDDGSRWRRRPSRRVLSLVIAPLIVLVILANIGDALAPGLVKDRPALLLALNARNRNLVLVTTQLDAWTYYGIGTIRLLLSDPLFFLLGMWYGDSAIKWMERRTRTWGQMLRTAQGWFGKAAYPLIFIAPNNAICLFAGAAGMPVLAFLAVNLAGTVTRLWLIRQFGDIFNEPLQDLVDWIGDNRMFLLPISIGFVILSILLEARRGETDVGSLAHLEDEIDEIEETDHNPRN